MSEEEIIKKVENIIYTLNEVLEDENYDYEEKESAKEQLEITQGLLDLYQKEKEKNNKIKDTLLSRVSNKKRVNRTMNYVKLNSKNKVGHNRYMY